MEYPYRRLKRVGSSIIITMLAMLTGIGSYADTVTQTPLFLGPADVPGNLSIVMSVEYPTVDSIANLGDYTPRSEYLGYFDPNKCYSYIYDADDETERHFQPTSNSSGHTCSGNYWSGNFLNWAGMSTIDPFRWALTGGYRIKDDSQNTWLQGARLTNQEDSHVTYMRSVDGASVVSGATPFAADSISIGMDSNNSHDLLFTLPNGATMSDGSSIQGSGSTYLDTKFDAEWNLGNEGASLHSASCYWACSSSTGNDLAIRNNHLMKLADNDDTADYLQLNDSVSLVSGESIILSGTFERVSSRSEPTLFLTDSSRNNSRRGFGFEVTGSTVTLVSVTGTSTTPLASTRASFNRYGVYSFNLSIRYDGAVTLSIGNSSVGGNVELSATAGGQASFRYIFVAGSPTYYFNDFVVRSESSAGGTDSAIYASDGSNQYAASRTVAVCVPGLLEANCVQYGSHYKPEGLLQEYSDQIRYSVFGYLNDPSTSRQGGVLRAPQEFIGAQMRDPKNGWQDNDRVEWNTDTGVLIQDPDRGIAGYHKDPGTDDADSYSGVINYINAFGEHNKNLYKERDPVGELYYAATRYFRGLSSPSSYYKVSGSSDQVKFYDNFPIFTDWYNYSPNGNDSLGNDSYRNNNLDDRDPIQYACQKNVILGIGDTNTAPDMDLPGSTYASRPDDVDTLIDVSALNNRVTELAKRSGDSDLGNNLSRSNPFQFGWSGGTNPGYMVGLAFDAHTRDLRKDWSGKQILSTYWVDVLEYREQKAKVNNQFWLLAKYGGFQPVAGQIDGIDSIDDINGPYETSLTQLPDDWWKNNNDKLDVTERFSGRKTGGSYDRADNYFPAGQANTMVESLQSAFNQIIESLTSTASALASNTARLETNTAIFSGTFYSGNWSGDLIASSTNSPDENADDNNDSDNQQQSTASGDIIGDQVWSAAKRLDDLNEGDIDNRLIVTTQLEPMDDNSSNSLQFVSDSTGVEFRWNQLSADQQLALQLSGDFGDSTVDKNQAKARVDYLRGDRTSESGSKDYVGPYSFRARGSRLGDIVNSTPTYSYKENYGYSQLRGTSYGNAASAYHNFQQGKENRTPIVAVGANDGMLHIFNATDDDEGGDEMFAFVPGAIVNNLYHLTESGYQHQYYVDGLIRVGDAYLSGNNSGWHTLLVSTEGAGGKSVFALDITDPSNMGTDSLLWEYTNNKMGRMIQRPALVALPNGDFGVVVSSGYDAPDTDNGTAYVWILDASTGALIKQIDIPTNGELGTPLAVDTNNSEVANRLYVGDTTGNLWRIDLDSTNTANWGLHHYSGRTGATDGLLFQAKDSDGIGQPITVPLAVASSSRGYPIVLFGTGSYYRENDNNIGDDPQIQSLYGIIDQSGSPVESRENLIQQSIIYENNAYNYEARVTSDKKLGGHRGWYLDLGVLQSGNSESSTLVDPGERVVSGTTLSGSEALFTTLIPSADPCQAGGDSWIMGLNINDGSRPQSGSFDLNDNGNPEDDTIMVDLPDGTQVPMYSSGFKSKKGVAPSVTVISVGNGASGTNRICYHGSEDAGETCVTFSGGGSAGRQSWRELINDSGIDFTGNGTNGN